MEYRGKHDEKDDSCQQEVEINQMSEFEESILKSQINGSNRYDLSKSPTASSNTEVARNSDFKDIPDMFQMLNKHAWEPYKQMRYKVYRDYKENKHNTRGKPVAVYTSFLRTIPVPYQASYDITFRKGSSTVKTWYSETTASVGGMFKGIEMSASVKTGYSYSNTFSEEESEKLTQTLDQGNYIVYQNKIVYAYEVQTTSGKYGPDNIMYLFNNQYDYDRGCPKLYRKYDRLFYFVEFNMNHPFLKRYTPELYDEPNFNDICNYLVSDHGWNRW